MIQPQQYAIADQCIPQPVLGQQGPTVIAQHHGVAVCQTSPREVAGAELSDDQRETAIKGCGLQMLAWTEEYERSHCMSARGTADFWRLRMQAFIAGRTAAKVANLEAERGLA